VSGAGKATCGHVMFLVWHAMCVHECIGSAWMRVIVCDAISSSDTFVLRALCSTLLCRHERILKEKERLASRRSQLRYPSSPSVRSRSLFSLS
jgi:hypothetical protein